MFQNLGVLHKPTKNNDKAREENLEKDQEFKMNFFESLVNAGLPSFSSEFFIVQRSMHCRGATSRNRPATTDSRAKNTSRRSS